MINLDQHDHTGGPNKGVPITSTGLADFSVTFSKLNSNVVDSTTGIGVNSTPGSQNQIVLLGILKNLFTLSNVPGVGFLANNGSTIADRVFTDSATVTWTNGDGVAGNPVANVNIAGISPVTVANGGTGDTSFSPWDIIVGGTTSTGNLQQVSGEGTLNQYLGSNGPGAIPSWMTLPTFTNNYLQSTVSMSAAQFTNLSASPVIVVPAPGVGNMIMVDNIVAKLAYGGIAFGSGSGVRFYYGSPSGVELETHFQSGSFKDSQSVYYYLYEEDSEMTSGEPLSAIANQPIVVSVNGSNFTGGAGNVVSMSVQYSIITI